MKYIIAILIIAVLAFLAFKTIPSKHQPSATEEPEMVELAGTIISQPFINKGKSEKDYYELYFKTESEKFYIKISDGNIAESELKKHIDQPVTFKVILKEGMLDVSEEELATMEGGRVPQSRFGKYLIIKSIVK